MAQIDPVSQLPAIILGEREKNYYKQLFMQVSKDGYVGLNAAVPFLTKSGLDKPQLGQIWNIVNANGQNSLNPNAFSVALRLVSLAQSGKPVSLQQLQATTEFELPRFQDIDLPSPPLTSGYTGLGGPTIGGNTSIGGGGISSNLFGGILGPTPTVQVDPSPILGQYGSSGTSSSAYSSLGNTGGGLPPPLSGSTGIYSSGSGVPASTGYGLGVVPGNYGGLLGSNSGTSASGGAGFAWAISETQRSQYKTLFNSAPKANPMYMSGAEAKDYFGKSGLSDQDLAKIWSLSDRNADNQLDIDEFVLAMFLTQAKRQGQALPNTIPDRLLQTYKTTPYQSGIGLGGPSLGGSLGGPGLGGSLGGPSLGGPSLGGPVLGSQGSSIGNQPYTGSLALAESAQDPWAINVADKQKYSEYFDKADVNRQGKISGQVAKELFVNFGLGNNELARIWTLSDLNHDGSLDKRGFCIAMHLIDCHRKGLSIPQILPQSLLDATAVFTTSNIYGQLQNQPRNVQGYGGGQFTGNNPLGGGYGGTGNLFVSTPTPVLFSTVNDLEQQERRRKEEQERQKTASIKEQIVSRLNQKAELINKIRVAQQQNIELAGMLSVQEQQVDRTKKVVKEMDVIIDRQKLRINAINDKIQLVQKTANIIREQKRSLDTVINQRQSQFQEEQSRLNVMAQKLVEEKNTRDKLREEIAKMRSELANMKNQKLHTEHRIAQIELQKRQEAEEAERRRLAEAAAAEERRLQAEAEERRRQAEAAAAEERRRQLEAAAAEERRRQLEAAASLQKQKEEDELRQNFERERQEIERKKAEIQNQKKALLEQQAQIEQGRIRNEPPGATADLTVNYEKYLDDFGTKVGGVPKGEGALYFGLKHSEFPLGFYPEFQDFGCLIFSFQSPQSPPAQAEPPKQTAPVTISQQVSQPQLSTEESDESSSDDPSPQSFQPIQPQHTVNQSQYGNQPPQTNQSIYGSQPPQTNLSQTSQLPQTNLSQTSPLPQTNLSQTSPLPQANQSIYGNQNLPNSSSSQPQSLQSSQTPSTHSAFSDMGFWSGDSTQQQVTPNTMQGPTEPFFGNANAGVDILFGGGGGGGAVKSSTDDSLFGGNWSSPQTQPQLVNDPFQGLFAEQPPAADTPSPFSNLFDD